MAIRDSAVGIATCYGLDDPEEYFVKNCDAVVDIQR
jgi:hypothetical protein